MVFQIQRFLEKTMNKKKNSAPEAGAKRPVSNKTYNKIFFIATEGVRTEPEYFRLLDSVLEKANQKRIAVVPTKNSNSSPKRLVKNMQNYLKKNKLASVDEAWIVCDCDGRTFDELKPVLTFRNSSNKREVAMTNPNFEYWLLLHFEDGKGVGNSNDCLITLKKHWPDYDKSISRGKFTLEKIKKAVSFLEKKTQLSNKDLIDEVGTTVHVLVRKIIGNEQ